MTTLIESLDLRHPDVIADEEDQAMTEMLDARYDHLWNWPVFPQRVATFIETGVLPSKYSKVRVMAAVAQLFDVMAAFDRLSMARPFLVKS